MSRINFTKRNLEALPRPTGDNYVTFRDAAVRGLGLKIEVSGHRTYFWSRKARGKLEYKTIGEYESVSLDDARAKASEFNRQLNEWKKDGQPGENPFARPAALTLGEVIKQYVARHIKHSAARPERAAKGVEYQLDRYLSDLKDRKVMTLRRGEILKVCEDVYTKHRVYAANRLIGMLRASLNWSIKAELWPGPNPAKGIQYFKGEVERDRFLRADEMVALRAALAAPETETDLRDYVRLLLMTGMRRNDMVTMRWDNVDLGRATVLVPKPKNRKPYFALLPEAAVEILKERAARAKTLQEKTSVASPWVFPGPGKTGHVIDLKRGWKSLLKRAGITDLRQHDCRRSFASWQSIGGASMLIISKALGQKNTGTTPVYARLNDAPVRASIEAAVRAMFTSPPTAAAASAPEAPKQLPSAPVAKRRRRA